MYNTENITVDYEMLIFTGVLILIPFMVLGIYFYFANWREDVKHIKNELRDSDTESEYNYWKYELYAAYLSLIPGISIKTAKKAFSRFRTCRHTKKIKKNNKDIIFKTLLPSVLCICICAICLLGSTYAWFNAYVASPATTLKAANYNVEVNITCGGSALSLNGNGYDLSADTIYTATLNAMGNASTVYCSFEFMNKSNPTQLIMQKHTQQFTPGDKITFNFKTNADTYLVVVPQWGTSSQTDVFVNNNPDVYTIDLKASLSNSFAAKSNLKASATVNPQAAVTSKPNVITESTASSVPDADSATSSQAVSSKPTSSATTVYNETESEPVEASDSSVTSEPDTDTVTSSSAVTSNSNTESEETLNPKPDTSAESVTSTTVSDTAEETTSSIN